MERVRVDQGPLGDLEHDRVARQLVVTQDGLDDVNDARLLELQRREVDLHAQGPGGATQAGELPACLVEDRLADLDDVARLLCERDEVDRADPPELGMRPARQRLEADPLTGRELDERLEVRPDLAAPDRAADCRSHPQAGCGELRMGILGHADTARTELRPAHRIVRGHE